MAPKIVVAALAAALLAPFMAHAAPAPASAPDPFPRTAALTTRDQILPALPSTDDALSAALRRPCFATEEHGWMQYFQ